MMAIVTKFYGPTNHRGSRIRATAGDYSKTYPYKHRLSAENNHADAARELADYLGWFGDYHMGDLPDGSRVFVRVSHYDDAPFFSLVSEDKDR